MPLSGHMRDREAGPGCGGRQPPAVLGAHGSVEDTAPRRGHAGQRGPDGKRGQSMGHGQGAVTAVPCLPAGGPAGSGLCLEKEE